MYEKKLEDAAKVVAIMKIAGDNTPGHFQALARAAEAFLLCSDWVPPARLWIIRHARHELSAENGAVATLRVEALTDLIAYWDWER